jgi:hypothetical protein
MEVTGQMLKDAYMINPSKLSHALADSIRDFGYPDITDIEIQRICREVIDGKASVSNPISILLNDWFENGM